jgi:hypothetical protein
MVPTTSRCEILLLILSYPDRYCTVVKLIDGVEVTRNYHDDIETHEVITKILASLSLSPRNRVVFVPDTAVLGSPTRQLNASPDDDATMLPETIAGALVSVPLNVHSIPL